MSYFDLPTLLERLAYGEAMLLSRDRKERDEGGISIIEDMFWLGLLLREKPELRDDPDLKAFLARANEAWKPHAYWGFERVLGKTLDHLYRSGNEIDHQRALVNWSGAQFLAELLPAVAAASQFRSPPIDIGLDDIEEALNELERPVRPDDMSMEEREITSEEMAFIPPEHWWWWYPEAPPGKTEPGGPIHVGDWPEPTSEYWADDPLYNSPENLKPALSTGELEQLVGAGHEALEALAKEPGADGAHRVLRLIAEIGGTIARDVEYAEHPSVVGFFDRARELLGENVEALAAAYRNCAALLARESFTDKDADHYIQTFVWTWSGFQYLLQHLPEVATATPFAEEAESLQPRIAHHLKDLGWAFLELELPGMLPDSHWWWKHVVLYDNDSDPPRQYLETFNAIVWPEPGEPIRVYIDE